MLKAYSFKLKQEVWLLNDEEYAPISAPLRTLLKSMKEYRSKFSVDLNEARERCESSQHALEIYENLTGDRLESVFYLYHIRLAAYGRLCPTCDKPFRTPRAKFCAECGYHLPVGEVAGPLRSSS